MMHVSGGEHRLLYILQSFLTLGSGPDLGSLGMHIGSWEISKTNIMI